MRRRDRGSLSLELAVLAPALLMIVGVVIFAGRMSMAHQAIETAAAEAARTASLQRDPTTASQSGTSQAAMTLADQGVRCVSSDVTVDVSGFNAPIGARADVTATITCVVDLADLVLPGVPGTKTITVTSSSAIDSYRSRP